MKDPNEMCPREAFDWWRRIGRDELRWRPGIEADAAAQDLDAEYAEYCAELDKERRDGRNYVR